MTPRSPAAAAGGSLHKVESIQQQNKPQSATQGGLLSSPKMPDAMGQAATTLNDTASAGRARTEVDLDESLE